MFGSLINRAGSYATRGIGTVNKVARTIGQVSPHIRPIGSIANNASGGRLANSKVGQKLMELGNRVEQGAKQVADMTDM